MEREQLDHRLSQIVTVWTVLRQAHGGPPSEAQAALQLLVHRYRGAVYRYLSRLLGDHNAADDLTQEFSLALLQGQLRSADPSRGRFRNYVKTVLFHLVSKYRQRASRLPAALDADSPLWQDLADGSDWLGAFNQSWRDELLARTWEALRQVNTAAHAVLEFRAGHPERSAQEMAEALGPRLGRELTAEGVRQTLHRARQKFAELLFDEVAHSLDTQTVAEVEEELAGLGLLEYCRPLLERG